MAKDTKERILQAASQLLKEKSFKQVSVREIAQRADCSHTAIYQYFKHKDEIFNTVAQHLLQALYEELRLVCQTEAKDKCLLKFASVFIDFAFGHRSAYELLFLKDGEPVDKEEWDSPVSQLRMNSFQLLQEQVEYFLPKHLTEAERLNISRGTFTFLHGLISIYSFDNSEYPDRIEDIMRDYLTYTIIQRGD